MHILVDFNVAGGLVKAWPLVLCLQGFLACYSFLFTYLLFTTGLGMSLNDWVL